MPSIAPQGESAGSNPAFSPGSGGKLAGGTGLIVIEGEGDFPVVLSLPKGATSQDFFPRLSTIFCRRGPNGPTRVDL